MAHPQNKYADFEGLRERAVALRREGTARFGKTTLKKHNPKTVRKNVGDHYRGCLVIGVVQSADLYRRIDGWWNGIVLGSAPASGKV